jgi:hypothetical protein
MTDGRAQLSLSVLEATLGLLFVVAVASGFTLAPPEPGVGGAQLERYAGDVGRLLAEEPAPGGRASLLAAASRSPERFAAVRDPLRDRAESALPATVLFRIETPQGAVGYRPPDGVAIGRATIPTLAGEATIRVWYA